MRPTAVRCRFVLFDVLRNLSALCVRRRIGFAASTSAVTALGCSCGADQTFPANWSARVSSLKTEQSQLPILVMLRQTSSAQRVLLNMCLPFLCHTRIAITDFGVQHLLQYIVICIGVATLPCICVARFACGLRVRVSCALL